MVGHHQAADPVGRGEVRGLPGQSHLDAGGTPGNEAGEFTLPDPLEAFMNLHRGLIQILTVGLIEYIYFKMRIYILLPTFSQN